MSFRNSPSFPLTVIGAVCLLGFGITTQVGGQVSRGQKPMANSDPVVLPIDQSPLPVIDTLSQVYLRKMTGGVPITGRLPGQIANVTANSLWTYQAIPPASYDPCGGSNKWNVAVSTAADAQLIPGAAGKAIHICGGVLVVTTAGSFSIVEGTGTTCATAILAVIGSTTGANGPPLAANGGFILGNGQATFAQGNIPGNNICILLSGTGRVAGNMEVAY